MKVNYNEKGIPCFNKKKVNNNTQKDGFIRLHNFRKIHKFVPLCQHAVHVPHFDYLPLFIVSTGKQI